MNENLFPKKTSLKPKIYAYILPDVMSHKGFIKIGYTERDVNERIKEQTHTAGVRYELIKTWEAMKDDGAHFTDKDVHHVLKRRGFFNLNAGNDKNEWFKCSIEKVEAAILAIKMGSENEEERTENFKMRPEQSLAVNRTKEYFLREKERRPDKSPKFLWNAKMRFGKTFTSYELAKEMQFKRVLILTFKPAVESAWHEDLARHIDFEGWQFISRDSSDDALDTQYQNADKTRPIVCFGSFQDFLGVEKGTGKIKAHNEWVHTTNWDLVIFDEYHFGAWREKVKQLFENDDDEYDEDITDYKRGDAYDESFLPITTDYYLFLSGTPFRALNSGEFIEEQIYNWTYSDEQEKKLSWADEHNGSDDENPYLALPEMVMMTYQLPESVTKIAKQGEFDEFDLNVFFQAEEKGSDVHFKYEEYVQKWLDLIRGNFSETMASDLKMGSEKPPMPYSDTRLLDKLSHTLWFLPDVASCEAMASLLKQNQNRFYHDYKINVCAGNMAGIGLEALEPVRRSMQNPLESKSITLSCGKLTTGVTIKPWTAIFMLRNLSSPETYFQAAFRVQSPWAVKKENGETEIIKKVCYVFDFALQRALRQISDYSLQLDSAKTGNSESNGNPEKRVADFIKFLPVLAYDGSNMKRVDAEEILDLAMTGTSATMLAKRWESALLVNVDNETLLRLLDNKDALDAIMKIEAFRNLNKEIETVINKSEAVKKAKTHEGEPTQKEKKEIDEKEKEAKSLRKQIQEKLIKFATRIPIFMYLSDFREYSLVDVIKNIEPQLFYKVTGITTSEFDLLMQLGVFNRALMNDAVYKFKRYEDASLSYTGLNLHEGEKIGGWE